MLVRSVNRVSWATVDETVVANTTQDADNPIVQLYVQYGWPRFRGIEDDILYRRCQTAVAHHAEVVVGITSNCLLIEPAVINSSHKSPYRQPGMDFTGARYTLE